MTAAITPRPRQASPLAGAVEGPRIRTEVPGPLSRQYLQRQEQYESSARSYPRNLPIAVKRAAGSFVEDVDGNVYLDCLTGAGVLSLGHSHPDVVRAVSQQLSEYVHGLDLPTPIKDEFTGRMLQMLPPGLRDRMKVHFCGPTGANAVEAAIKLCKIATGRSEVVSFQGAFHGSTAAAMAVSGNVAIKDVVASGLPGVHFFPYSYCSRCPVGLTPDSCSTNCVAYLEKALADPGGGVARPAAVIMEVIQGEGGVVPATPEFVRRVRAVTQALDIPLIVDEVQSGCGRTGTWFAFEQYGIEPDIVVTSKGLSGVGLPVSLLLFDRELDVWDPGAHIGTFRGNQLAFAGGVAALDVFEREGILDNVRDRGQQLADRLGHLARRHACIAEVRGAGLLLGLELTDPVTGAPAGTTARAVQAAALRNGLILELGGRGDCVVRLLPPLNVTAVQVEMIAEALGRAFAEADPELRPDGVTPEHLT